VISATETEPEDLKENIKSKFLVEMPEDFYQFWEFCSNINPEDPCGNFCINKHNTCMHFSLNDN